MEWFLLGERVESKIRMSVYHEHIEIGDTGTVCCENFAGGVGVSWDKLTCGHSCDGKCETGKGWYIPRDYIKLHSKEKEEEKEDAVINEDSFLAIISKV